MTRKDIGPQLCETSKYSTNLWKNIIFATDNANTLILLYRYMKKSFIFLADGFEELEALSPIDIMRRAGMDIITVSIHDRKTVTGAHGVPVTADTLIEDIDCADADWLICPGGLPGAQYLHECDKLNTLLLHHYNAGAHVAAICASPALVLAPTGIIDSRAATCYPGMEEHCSRSIMKDRYVVTDGNVVTGQGPAAAIEFGLKLVEISLGKEAAESVAAGMLIGRH